MLAHLLRGESLPSVDLGSRAIDVGEPLRREKMIEVFGVLEVVTQHVCDIGVNALEAGGCSSTLGFLEQIVVQVNLVHALTSYDPFHFIAT
jgi:hypothetical protein